VPTVNTSTALSMLKASEESDSWAATCGCCLKPETGKDQPGALDGTRLNGSASQFVACCESMPASGCTRCIHRYS
jgi:hypothetical protein